MRGGGDDDRQDERGTRTRGDETLSESTVPGAAVLTLRRHDEFLSVACEVSCRVRTGDGRPHIHATSPRAVPDFRIGGLPGSPAPAVRDWVQFPDGGRIRRSIRIAVTVSEKAGTEQALYSQSQSNDKIQGRERVSPIPRRELNFPFEEGKWGWRGITHNFPT
ncbi:hypothetical protein GCM10020367_66500 [Streptomyces sannanensis]|uniref:Uncharacterized protein n=1 Tax=Streptomyces sannanensis TaxID=285536 RepID=A0ABP6SM17_9ACTN